MARLLVIRKCEGSYSGSDGSPTLASINLTPLLAIARSSRAAKVSGRHVADRNSTQLRVLIRQCLHRATNSCVQRLRRVAVNRLQEAQRGLTCWRFWLLHSNRTQINKSIHRALYRTRPCVPSSPTHHENNFGTFRDSPADIISHFPKTLVPKLPEIIFAFHDPKRKSPPTSTTLTLPSALFLLLYFLFFFNIGTGQGVLS